MHQLAINTSHVDHCRIGSLETMTPMTEETVKDHCRIGSLEIYLAMAATAQMDHCRIGSLENAMRTQFVEKI